MALLWMAMAASSGGQAADEGGALAQAVVGVEAEAVAMVDLLGG